MLELHLKIYKLNNPTTRTKTTRIFLLYCDFLFYLFIYFYLFIFIFYFYLFLFIFWVSLTSLITRNAHVYLFFL